MRVRLKGHIDKEGRTVLNDKYKLDEFIERNKGKQFLLTIENEKKYRSNSQNAYYWGVVLNEVAQGLLDAGYDVAPGAKEDIEAIHEMLKGMFARKRQVENREGQAIELPASTSAMTKDEFAKYIEDISRWAAEFLGITISSPNETYFENSIG